MQNTALLYIPTQQMRNADQASKKVDMSVSNGIKEESVVYKFLFRKKCCSEECNTLV